VPPAPHLADQVVARLQAQPLAPLAPHRRPRSLFQGVAALLTAALVALIAFSLHRNVREAQGPPATPTPVSPVAVGPGGNIAWLQGQNAVVGVDPQGHMVATVHAPTMLRSPDGSELYGIFDTYVNVYSSASGNLERRIDRVAHGLDGSVSPDGRYLVLAGAQSEVIDLKAGQSVGLVSLDRALGGSEAFSQPIVVVLVATNASRIYIFTNFWTSTTLAIVSFDPSSKPSMQVLKQARSGQAGHQLPACDGMEPINGAAAPVRLLPDGKSVVSFCPGDGTVSWFDLNRLTITKQITVPHQNPFWVSPAFSRAGETLVLHEAGSGRIEVIDLHKRTTVHSSTLSASASFNPFGWLADRLFLPAYAGGIPRSVVLSPDGTRAYAAMGDLWSVALPSLHVLSRKAVSDGATSIWLSGDGNTIYALNNGGTELSVLQADGTLVAKVPLPTPTYDFLQF
jgi:hypothetical protein